MVIRRLVQGVGFLCALLTFSVEAEIYKCYREGRIIYTDHPTLRNCRLLKWAVTRSLHTSRNLARRWDPLIRKVARKYGLDPKLLHAVIEVESSYNPRAVSPKGAVGLMQLMPQTARRYGISPRERFNPHKNLEAGARYLKDLIRMFNGDLRLALAAYNAGEHNVIRYGYRIPPFRETRLYVAKIMNRYHP